MNPLKDYYPKDVRALVALIASIVFGGILIGFAWYIIDILNAYGNRLITELVRDPNVKASVGNVLETVINTLAWGLKIVLAGMIVLILSLGFAVNRRSFKLSKSGLDFEGGDGFEPPPTPVKIVNQPAEAVPVAETPLAPVPPPSKWSQFSD